MTQTRRPAFVYLLPHRLGRPSDASALSPPLQYAIHVAARTCPLLATPPPIRSLVLDHGDDRTAIRYLSACRTLRAGYHAYPVKRAMSLFSSPSQCSAAWLLDVLAVVSLSGSFLTPHAAQLLLVAGCVFTVLLSSNFVAV